MKVRNSIFGTLPGGQSGRALRCSLLGACALLAQAASAAKCSIDSTGVTFGTYDIFSPTANNDGIGTLHVDCKGSSGEVKLSTGHSHSYAAREMTSGANSIHYNLYINPARSVVWGDGTGGSHTMTVDKNHESTVSVYGQIPAGQDAAVGLYSDHVTATVDY